MYTQFKKTIKIILICLVLSIPSLAGLHVRLNMLLNLCNNSAVVQPNLVAGLTVGTNIRIDRPDGTSYEGKVTEVEESDTVIKIKGEGMKPGEFYFGFTLARGGVFAGAILDKTTSEERVYSLEFCPELAGYIFLYTNKYNKPKA